MPAVQLTDLAYALVGVGALLAAVLPRLLAHRPVSMPITFLALGLAIFAIPTGLPDPDPLEHAEAAEHLNRGRRHRGPHGRGPPP